MLKPLPDIVPGDKRSKSTPNLVDRACSGLLLLISG